MSMYDTSGKRPIPTAVLVPPTDAKPERPAPKRKAGPNRPPVPWVQIIAGGSAVWLVVVVVMALYAIMQNRNQALEGPPIPAHAIVLGEQAPPALAQQEPFEDGDAKPAAPKLAFRDVKQVNNAVVPPPLEVFADEPGKPAAVKAAHRDVNPELYVSCDQIGTKVLFMRDPPEAFKRAKAENKMVFMVHLSGNLEDKDFT